MAFGAVQDDDQRKKVGGRADDERRGVVDACAGGTGMVFVVGAAHHTRLRTLCSSMM